MEIVNDVLWMYSAALLLLEFSPAIMIALLMGEGDEEEG